MEEDKRDNTILMFWGARDERLDFVYMLVPSIHLKGQSGSLILVFLFFLLPINLFFCFFFMYQTSTHKQCSFFLLLCIYISAFSTTSFWFETNLAYLFLICRYGRSLNKLVKKWLVWRAVFQSFHKHLIKSR